MARCGTKHHKSPLCGFYYTVDILDLQEVFLNFPRKKLPLFLVFSRFFGTFEHLFDCSEQASFWQPIKMLFFRDDMPQNTVVSALNGPPAPLPRLCADCTILEAKILPFAQKKSVVIGGGKMQNGPSWLPCWGSCHRQVTERVFRNGAPAFAKQKTALRMECRLGGISFLH